MITLITISSFILGYLFCHFAEAKGWRSLYEREHDENKKLVNEFSIRTGGRKVFTPERKPVEVDEYRAKTDEYRIMVPSMAEAEEEERATEDDLPMMSMEDLEHLQNSGVLR
jgi:hypothetical protein